MRLFDIHHGGIRYREKKDQYVVCYSGGHSSALAAVETVRRFGNENVILLNHDISSKVESIKIKKSGFDP